MPVTAADFIALPYDDSLTRAGIEYARKSLHYTYNRMALPPAARLRNIVAGIAVELALVRYLQSAEIPFDRLGSTHFTRRDWYDLGLAGRRVDLKTTFVNRKEKLHFLLRDPGWLLEAEALVPVDQFESGALQADDVYLFGFLAGLETRGANDLHRAMRAREPLHLLHTLNRPAWTRGAPWRSLGRLALKSNASAPVEVEIGGQGRNLEPLVERLALKPRVRVQAEADFYSVLYLHVPALPDGEVGLHSPALKDTQLVTPKDWDNIWVYGMAIWLVGYLTQLDFRRKSRRLRPGTRVRQYDRTQAENWAVPVSDLRPVSELLEAARAKR